MEPLPTPKRPRRRRRLLDAVRVLLLLVGIGALGYYSYVFLDAKVYDAYENWAFDQELKGAKPSVTAFLRDEFSDFWGKDEQGAPDGDLARARQPEGALSPNASPPPASESEHPAAERANPKGAEAKHAKPPTAAHPESLIGRIDIPRLNIRAIVQEGVDSKTLRRAVGHVPSTALPGEDGNIGLAAHRDTIFRPLRHIKKNDHIRLETLGGDYEYVVESIRIVTPKDVEVLAPSKNPVLTLVTCYPFYYVGHAPKRFIVRARQVKDKKPADVPGT